MKHLDLFAGIGGFSLAARGAGWETVAAVEWNPYCQAILKKNFPNAVIFGDIRTFNGACYAGQVDIITGGFPCQPYSQAGKRAGNDDDRALWPEMLRIIREVAPPWVVGENVAGILTMDGGRVLAGILANLEDAGYIPEVYSIPAIGVGAPHERERIWIVAHRQRIGRAGWAATEARHIFSNGHDGKGQSAGEFTGAVDPIENAGCEFGQVGGLRTREDAGGQANEHGYTDRGRNWSEHWFPVATRLCRVDDGIPAGLDGTGKIPAPAGKRKASGKSHRLEALGNAIVPQVAFQIFDAINQYERL